MLRNLLSMSGVNTLKSILQFLMTMLVTHFVGPAEFGLIAFSLPFIAFISLITDLGLSSALVQRKELDARDAGAATTLMISAGIVCAGILAVASGPLAGALKMAGLAAVLAALSTSVVLSIASLAPRAVLERSLRYQAIASVELGSAVAASVACIACALAGGGIWALIAYYVLTQVIRLVSYWLMAASKVALNFEWRRVRSILTFGGWVLAANILNFAARNVGNLLVGATLGAAAVGLYALSFQFMLLPLMVITWPSSGVLMATLSRFSGEPFERKRAGVICSVFSITAMITFPAMFYLTFGLIYPVSALLSEKWAGIIPLIAVLAPAGALQSIASYVGAILLSRGEAQLQFWVSAANSVVLVLSFAIALPFGLMAMAKFYVAASIVLCVLTVWLGARRANIASVILLQAFLPGAVATGAGLAVAMAATAGDVTTFPRRLMATTIYFGLVLIVGFMFKRRILRDITMLRGGLVLAA